MQLQLVCPFSLHHTVKRAAALGRTKNMLMGVHVQPISMARVTSRCVASPPLHVAFCFFIPCGFHLVLPQILPGGFLPRTSQAQSVCLLLLFCNRSVVFCTLLFPRTSRIIRINSASPLHSNRSPLHTFETLEQPRPQPNAKKRRRRWRRRRHTLFQ